MSNTKYKKLCLVKCVIKGQGITIGNSYKVFSEIPHSLLIRNDYDIITWYGKKYFKEVK